MKLLNKNFILGLLLVPVIAVLAYGLSSQIGQLMGFTKSPLSPVILAILLGLIIGNVVKLSDQSYQAIQFYLNYILKLGIVLLGIRISFNEILTYGKLALPLVLVVIITVLILAKLIGRFLDLPAKLTALIAVGTAICGATAIVASTALIKAKKEETAYAVAIIAIFGSIAMVSYPYLSNILFDGESLLAGLFLGVAIHDTAQVTGAALIYAQQFASEQVLDIATTTKLLRNSLMIIVIPIIVIIYAKQDSNNKKVSYKKAVPLFVLGFLVMVALRSIGDFSLEQSDKAFGLLTLASFEQIIKVLQNSALICLILAMTAVGLSTNIKALITVGIKPLLAGFILALLSGLVAFAVLTLL